MITLSEEARGRVSEAVRHVIDSCPWMRRCLAERIVNFSELARRIKPVVERIVGEAVSLDSIKMALIRYSEKLKERSDALSEKILQILAKSVIEVRTGVSVVTVSYKALPKIAQFLQHTLGKARFVAVMQGVSSITMIVDDEHLDELLMNLEKSEILDLIRDQVALTVISPPEIVSTPGVLESIVSTLASRGINITQIESCYTDTIILVSRNNLVKAFEAINELIEIARSLVKQR